MKENYEMKDATLKFFHSLLFVAVSQASLGYAMGINMKKEIIVFKDFTFRYRTQKKPTLTNINLTLYEGEKVLIIGPSGSGKSTLAHCINGLIPNSFEGEIQGSVVISGNDPAKVGIFGISQRVGTVMQDMDSQFIGLTVGEDIAFVMENDCIPQATMKDTVRKYAELVGVDKLLSQAPSALSGGQKQRVAIAGIMTNDADILLFDEPLANLDPATGQYAIELIDEIHQTTKKTIILIEHRLEDVLHRPVDRIIVVGDGKILSDTTPDELLSQSILKENGIREPLYITAVKYSGGTIQATDHPSNIHNMSLINQRDNILNWYQSIPEPEPVVDTQKLLIIKDLTYAYQKGKDVLTDVSFSIHKGEMVSIVGRNGAGKSTLSKLICGFIRPRLGTIFYQGRDMAELSIAKHAEKIGLVMQNPNQMISKPMIYDEVALGLRTRGYTEASVKEKVEHVLKVCGLYPFRNWPISALSFGQKKRVTIASILVLEPEILILDEPTAGQDYRHYTEIMKFLEKLRQDIGITILMITHDMHLMLEYADRTIVISDGILVADDRPAKILTMPGIAEKANLKVTSLYYLAEACEISEARGFVESFIRYDREVNH
ncbi:MAG: transporter [Anaerocolumna sp.]|nr:transporter [Anaerocolumna sp.]